MHPRNRSRRSQSTALQFSIALSALAFSFVTSAAQADEVNPNRFVQISARTKEERTVLANLGMSIEFTRSDSVWGFATPEAIEAAQSKGFTVMGNFDMEVARGGHENSFDFPTNDSRFHNYDETMSLLNDLNTQYGDITRLHVIGKSIEGRNLVAMHINTSTADLDAATSSKPGFILMGAHHAREHLSVEIPLMYTQYLLEHRATDSKIAALLDSRDIWVIPIVNPDGKEYDISTGQYKMWRKNRRKNSNGTYGVDLNRNYGFQWGTGGSSTDPQNDTYMGPAPFSEPETQAIRDFVGAHLNAKVLMTTHTFSELILYPWGHKYDAISNTRDHDVFSTMARTMAQWNKYTPEQASELYIASGDTTDWAYGTYGIFAFTFELSPKSMWDGGFYPGQGVIDRVFNDNLRPLLYMLDVAGDPYKVVSHVPTGWLESYVAPQIDERYFWEPHPLPESKNFQF